MSEAPHETSIRVIVGPTAAGKSEVALEIAADRGAEIVVIDSRLVYRRLNIGTAKPDARSRQRVRHHMLDLVDPTETYDAMRYAADGGAALAEIRGRGKQVLLEGGTGLYLRALLAAGFDGPGADHALRDELSREAELRGPGWLHAELARVDPESATRLHPHDTFRLVRALEISRSSGRPASEVRRGLRARAPARPARIAILTRPKPELDRRIAERWELMVRDGLVEEVRALLGDGYAPDLPSLRTPGYRQVIAHLAGELSWAEACAQAITATRRYAKRQLTWFRHQLPGATWVEIGAGGLAEATRRVRAVVMD